MEKKETSRMKFQEKFGKPIEEFDAIKRAVEALRETTTKNYYRVLPAYFIYLGEDPDQVIENRRKDIGSKNYEEAERYERRTMSYAQALLTRGHSGRAVQGFIGRIQGFFANNSRRYSLDMRRLKLPKARKFQKYSPSNEEIRHLYTLADSSRDKLILALMYQNGLSPVDVSNLKAGDLPQAEWAYYEKSRSKTGEVWHGIITPDIAYELKTYLTVRGDPDKNEPLFLGSRGPLDNQAISRIISDLIEKSELKGNSGFKPTSLRDAFEDALVDSNVHQKIKECLMGHVSGIEHQYGGQNRLVAVCTEAMKKAYPFLTLNGLTRESSQTKNLENRIRELEKKYDEMFQRAAFLSAAMPQGAPTGFVNYDSKGADGEKERKSKKPPET
jgi:integrase